MIRKRDINDWLLWLMVLNLYMAKHSWTDLLLCLVGAVVICWATEVINEKYFERRNYENA